MEFRIYNSKVEVFINAENSTLALISYAKSIDLDYEAIQPFYDGIQGLVGSNDTQWDQYYSIESGRTAPEKTKAAGLKNIIQVIELSGVPRQTLTDWAETKPLLFDVILLGCVQKLKLRKLKSVQEG